MIASIASMPSAAQASRSPLANARLALGASLRAYEAQDRLLRGALKNCFLASGDDLNACVQRALGRYERYAETMQLRVKRLRRLEPFDRCQATLDSLEQQVVRIGIASRVIITNLPSTPDPALAQRGARAWAAARGYFTRARAKTRAACSGM